MSKPSDPATLNRHHPILGLCFLVHLFIRDLFRPEDATYSPETSSGVEGTDLVRIAFYHSPAIRTIKQNWFDNTVVWFEYRPKAVMLRIPYRFES